MTRARTLAALLVVAMLATTAGCSTLAPPDQVGLFYYKGEFDGNKFHHCVKPGSSDEWEANNEVYWVPGNVRTWNIAKTGGDTATPITVAAKPENNQPSGVQVNVYPQTNLTLNTYCGDDNKDANSPLVQWWEKYGRRYEANTEEGWKRMLQNTVVTALETATRNVVRGYSADLLVAGTILPEVQQRIAAEFAIELKRVVGRDYFCGPTFDRLKADCPPVEVIVKDVDYTDPGIQEARNAKQKALEIAAAQVAEAEGKVRAAAAQKELYTNEAWLRLQELQMQLDAVKACAPAAGCTVVIGVNGSILVK